MCLSDLQTSQSFEHYSISDKAMDYRILQMDEDQDRMYVGCKDHVLSMDINNVTHGTLKVSICLQLWCAINIYTGIIYCSIFFSLTTSKEKIKCLFSLTVCEAHHQTAPLDIIVIAAMICKLPYIWLDQDTFGVI